MASNSEQNIILSISGSLFFMEIYSKNIKTRQEQTCCIEFDTYAALFDKLRTFVNLSNVKACLFRVLSFYEGYEFRLRCREFCEKNGIYCWFGDDIELKALAAVTKTRTMLKEGEEILFVVSAPSGTVNVAKIIREKNYYRISKNLTFGLQYLQKTYLKNYQPKKTIILHNSYMNKSMDSVNKCLKKYKPIILSHGRDQELINEAMMIKIFHLMGEKFNPYDIASRCRFTYKIVLSTYVLFKICNGEVVPLEKSAITDFDSKQIVSVYGAFTSPNVQLEQIKLSSFKSKKVKVTLKVDINSFYELNVVPVEDEKPKLKVGDKPEKVQIIFDKQNFSVTLFANGSKEYAMKDSDGLEKTPIYIAFTQKKPFIGKAAKEAYDKKPEFVVYDLIKLCSISSSDVMNPKWKFELSKDPESDAIAVTFQSEKGKTKSDVPFLMALILRNAIKRVLTETSELVSELEIGFDGFSPNEMLKKNFVEAGKLMKCNVDFI